VSGYEWDVFISYRREKGNVQAWVHNHFAPTLRRALQDEVDWEPRIFIDEGIEVGTPWGEQLETALQRTHLLLPIFSPPYFTSAWCLAEWETMRARELMLRESGWTTPLTYPIRYSDGDRFPVEARDLEQETCFKEYKFPYKQFAESQRYLDFHEAVSKLAERLAGRLDDPPPWRADWPVRRPEPVPAEPTLLPRL
jgi:hypothetical protein